MSNRPSARRNAKRTASRSDRSLSPLLIALIAVAVVTAVGIAIAVAGGEDGDDPDVASFGPVAVEGEALPEYPGGGADPAVGQQVPVVQGRSPAAEPVELGAGEPTIAVFLAHWCPHCQAELPRLVELQEDGAFDGVRTVAVLTGTNEDAPNYPPVEWIEEEGWQGDVLLDDDEYAAAEGYGLAGYPFMVAFDADGTVVERSSGERPEAEWRALAEALRG